jgi:hypothetical protein
MTDDNRNRLAVVEMYIEHRYDIVDYTTGEPPLPVDTLDGHTPDRRSLPTNHQLVFLPPPRPALFDHDERRINLWIYTTSTSPAKPQKSYEANFLTMHLMYYLDGDGKRVYTLKVRTNRTTRDLRYHGKYILYMRVISRARIPLFFSFFAFH